VLSLSEPGKTAAWLVPFSICRPLIAIKPSAGALSLSPTGGSLSHQPASQLVHPLIFEQLPGARLPREGKSSDCILSGGRAIINYTPGRRISNSFVGAANLFTRMS